MSGKLTKEQKKAITDGDISKIKDELWKIANEDKPIVLKAMTPS